MRCVAIDDEPMGLNLIKTYIEKTPFLVFEAGFTDPFKALNWLMNNKCDLLFLDINMPELSGIQLLRSLRHVPMIIFTTAYPEFGAESYEYNAIDYLLKPIMYDRFLRAVSKATETKNTFGTKTVISEMPETSNHILVKSGNKIHRIKTEEILYVEAAGNYSTFHLSGMRIMSLLTLSEATGLLPPSAFIRIHKSYIVSIDKLDIIERHQVTISGKTLPIGLTYRDSFIKQTSETGKRKE